MSNSDDDSVDDDRKESVLTLDKPSEDVTKVAAEPDAEEAESADSEPTAPGRLKRRIATGLVALLAVAVPAMDSGSIMAKVFGFLALVMASVNIFGGFLVTNRMLAMYKKKER